MEQSTLVILTFHFCLVQLARIYYITFVKLIHGPQVWLDLESLLSFTFYLLVAHWAPLNRITLGPEEFDSNNRIRLFDTFIRISKNCYNMKNIYFKSSKRLKF